MEIRIKLAISKYHYFGFTDKALQLKTTVNCAEVKEYELCKIANKATDQQKEAWITDLPSSFPDAEPVPGLAPIKQCKLYLKWRPLVPDQFKDEICPKPPKEVMDSWESIADACAYYKVTRLESQKVASGLGDETFNDIALLSGVTDSDYVTARDAAELNPLRRGAMNLVYCACKCKYGLGTTVVDEFSERQLISRNGSHQ